jgi:hypothetical protein
MTPSQRDAASRELDWFFSRAQSLLEFPSIQGAIEARLNGVGGSGPLAAVADKRILAVQRAMPIRAAFRRMEPVTVHTLQMAFTPRGWRGKEAVDYLNPYGDRLAPIVKYYTAGRRRITGETQDSLRLMATQKLAHALATFVMNGGVG